MQALSRAGVRQGVNTNECPYLHKVIVYGADGGLLTSYNPFFGPSKLEGFINC